MLQLSILAELEIKKNTGGNCENLVATLKILVEKLNEAI